MAQGIDRDSAPLDVALRELMSEQERLSVIVVQLTARLEPVLRSEPGMNAVPSDEIQKAMVQPSAVTRSVQLATAMTTLRCSEIADLLHRLEV